MFDLIVIGGGPGGYVAALRAAQLGLKVACVDKRPAFGGTCLNVGCIPSKALLDSSEWLHIAQHKLANHGIGVGRVTVDLVVMMKRKSQVVKSLTDGVGFLLKKNKVTAITGTAKLLGGGKVEIDRVEMTKETIEGKNILLATGSEVAELPSLKFDHQFIVDSTDALAFTEVPKHLIIVGGGYIGLELGSIWKRLGAKVTVLEFLPRLLPNTDGEIATLVRKSLDRQGLEFHLETKVTGARVSKSSVTVTSVGVTGKELAFTGDKVLVAVGRRPFTEGLGLAELGVKQDEKSGRVEVDKHFQTNVPGVYAVGDLIAGPMLAHKASEEGVAVAEYLAGKPSHVSYDTIPSVIYIWPEVASVGPTEEQIKESGRPYRVGKFPFLASGRAKAMDETEGVVKVIADAQTDRLLAVHIFGPRASDMIAEAVAVMEFQGSAEDLARLTHSHPSLSESLGEAARAAWTGSALHA
ncbi:MAG TPA: dihydrolipoyl dehydrogenase [Gemmataceae bacterium]|jgi:dihydrolipoamide dehydrogenase|nr:dihydrolipoyl dehydrogenase [Gemmataceae bacterium]